MLRAVSMIGYFCFAVGIVLIPLDILLSPKLYLFRMFARFVWKMLYILITVNSWLICRFGKKLMIGGEETLWKRIKGGIKRNLIFIGSMLGVGVATCVTLISLGLMSAEKVFGVIFTLLNIYGMVQMTLLIGFATARFPKTFFRRRSRKRNLVNAYANVSLMKHKLKQSEGRFYERLTEQQYLLRFVSVDAKMTRKAAHIRAINPQIAIDPDAVPAWVMEGRACPYSKEPLVEENSNALVHGLFMLGAMQGISTVNNLPRGEQPYEFSEFRNASATNLDLPDSRVAPSGGIGPATIPPVTRVSVESLPGVQPSVNGKRKRRRRRRSHSPSSRAPARSSSAQSLSPVPLDSRSEVHSDELVPTRQAVIRVDTIREEPPDVAKTPLVQEEGRSPFQIVTPLSMVSEVTSSHDVSEQMETTDLMLTVEERLRRLTVPRAREVNTPHSDSATEVQKKYSGVDSEAKALRYLRRVNLKINEEGALLKRFQVKFAMAKEKAFIEELRYRCKKPKTVKKRSCCSSKVVRLEFVDDQSGAKLSRAEYTKFRGNIRGSSACSASCAGSCGYCFYNGPISFLAVVLGAVAFLLSFVLIWSETFVFLPDFDMGAPFAILLAAADRSPNRSLFYPLAVLAPITLVAFFVIFGTVNMRFFRKFDLVPHATSHGAYFFLSTLFGRLTVPLCWNIISQLRLDVYTEKVDADGNTYTEGTIGFSLAMDAYEFGTDVGEYFLQYFPVAMALVFLLSLTGVVKHVSRRCKGPKTDNSSMSTIEMAREGKKILKYS
eukprot:gnl/Chilomastix_cuspidata/583.p1 GENE.gnl/Chilomastix_cuspidata/583~~gnl/Chilomastix_cuspidata/583.p1  ORF type:complete len:835 (-),score=348.23 gnl/Chilomastix_cuspidata/583:30-2360(-)